MKTKDIYEIEAEIIFPLNSKRKGAFVNGYRPGFSINIDENTKQYSGSITLIGREELKKGERAIGTICFITFDFFEQLKVGREYPFWEGPNFIGTAKVISIRPIRTMKPLPPRAAELQKNLNLQPHPEGGYYSEVYRSTEQVHFNGKSRSALTSIYFLLTRGDVSRWHVVDADESWHFYEGDPIELYIMPPDFSSIEKISLGTYDADGTKPVHIVPAGWWQASRSSGEYSLCGCAVAPGFEFSGFRMLNDEEKRMVKEDFPELAFLV